MFVLYGLHLFPQTFHVPASIEHASFDDVIHAAPIVGRYMGLIGILSAIIQGGLIRRLVPRFGETTLAIAGPVFLAISFLVLGLAQNWFVVIVGCALMPLGFGLNNPALQSLISRASPSEEQGAYLGLNQSMLSLARMTGPLCAGLLFDTSLGARSPFLAGSGVLVGCALLAKTYRSRYGASFPRKAPVLPVEA